MSDKTAGVVGVDVERGGYGTALNQVIAVRKADET